MNMKYEEGMLVKLYENDDEEYYIIRTIEIDNETYLLLQLVGENVEEIKLELDKLYIVKLGTSDDFEYVKDANLIKNIILKGIKEEQNKQ